MEQIEFPQDFSEFLKLLNAHHVEYLLIGGFAVAIDGVDFDECASRAEIQTFDGNSIPVISLSDLKINKRASGRAKDLDDLENLP